MHYCICTLTENDECTQDFLYFQQVVACDSKSLKLTRYAYNRRYALPVVEDGCKLVDDDTWKSADFKEVHIYYIAATADDEYSAYIPGFDLKTCDLNHIRNDVEGSNRNYPVIFVVPICRKGCLPQLFPRLQANTIVLLSGTSEASISASSNDGLPFQKLLFQKTSKETFVKDIDCALERYMFSFLKETAEKLAGLYLIIAFLFCLFISSKYDFVITRFTLCDTYFC